MELGQILKYALEQNASDIIITWWNRPSFKINWEVVFLSDAEIISKEDSKKIVLSIMNETQKTTFLEKFELDFSIELRWFARFRVNAFIQKDGYGLVFRPIKDVIVDFEELNLPETIKSFTKKQHWLVLITWAVWSWKSTTLTSLIEEINQEQQKHIITIEDPIEFIFKNKNSIVEQREVWVHTQSFDNWLKYALRQAPDVIMVWEMRDLETFRLALRAAETWNLVFATLHTSWAARTVARIIDMFPWDEKDKIRQQISESLVWVVRQQLLKTTDNKRIAAVEILVNNISVSNMIRKDQTHQIQNVIETWKEDWMITMKSSIQDLFDRQVISEDLYKYHMDLLDRS